MKLYNEEYTILSLASFILFCLVSLFGLNTNIVESTENVVFAKGLYISITFIFGLLSLCAIGLIHHVSCIGNTMMKRTTFYMEKYIKLACDLGIIDANEEKKAKDVLNPLRSI